MFGVVKAGEVCMATTVPVPVSVYSPTTPALSYRILVVVPLVMVVVPTLIGEKAYKAPVIDPPPVNVTPAVDMRRLVNATEPAPILYCPAGNKNVTPAGTAACIAVR